MSGLKELSAGIVAVTIAAFGSQAPLGPDASDSRQRRSAAAMQALDRYLETWNSRDPKRWATSLHFPHIRPGPGTFELSRTPEEYAAGVDFQQTLATGWHHSEWTTRRLLHVGFNKVHVAGAWQRYTAEGRPLTGSVISYVVTNQGGRWGVLSRFAAGPTGIGDDEATANGAAGRAAVEAYVRAWNSHDPQTLVAAIHFPYVRVDGDGRLEMWTTPAEFLDGSEPWRQRTWFEIRLDGAEVVQASSGGVNVVVRCSLLNRSGEVLSQYEALLLAVRRMDQWKLQAVSTMGA